MLKMGAQELEDMETNWWGVEMKGFGVFIGGSWQKSFQASGWGAGLLKEEELAWDLACPVSGSSALFWSLSSLPCLTSDHPRGICQRKHRVFPGARECVPKVGLGGLFTIFSWLTLPARASSSPGAMAAAGGCRQGNLPRVG